ncbi:cupin domain-containing protein [Brevundimonas diminuta]|uniref:cupin domain-containing protein n=1 Tax=Brevundimonas diminuta TaxID=293 RepID=UPI002096F5E4|nr:cupin domain-containing protein [Brevundimonas diminuta]MCO8017660.1 cupin domain-containing protein [Brevundimonas diminuta]MCO8021180.1 cupin domain-containing protein [Brevundimonas diminuta]
MEFTVDEVIDSLGLKPLENGGWGRVMAAGEETAPSGVVSAYRLLTPEMSDDWRAVEVDELWTAYMGAALEVELATKAGVRRETLTAGSGRWLTVPAGGWVRTRVVGGWCLAGRIGTDQGLRA